MAVVVVDSMVVAVMAAVVGSTVVVVMAAVVTGKSGTVDLQ
jgi:hypothetical protein